MKFHLAAARAAVVLGCMFVVTLGADGPKRPAAADAARSLVRIFEITGRRASAAADPSEPGVFVAAVYTGTDLFLVRAHHPVAEELRQLIQSGQHQRAFFALRATPTLSGKFFVFDAAADGLLTTARQEENVDEAREDDVRIVRFNGDWAGQRLTRLEYAERLAATDARYASLLNLLVRFDR